MKRITGILFVLLISCQIANGQITAQLGAGLGWASPASDYTGTTIEYYDGVKYGLSSGLNLHGKARAAILGFGLVGEVNYSSFSNSGAAFIDEKGEVEAQVISAQQLSDEEQAQLSDTLRSRVGKTVTLNTSVDESLIGGLVVKVGSQMIDTSIRSKLAALRNTMKEVG